MKKIKRALAVFLATITLVVSVLTMHVQSVQAVAIVDDIAALFYAAVYASAAASGYNVTKHQNTEMTNELASGVKDYFKYIRGSLELSELVTLDKEAWLELAVDEASTQLQKSISDKISKYVWGSAAEQMSREEIYSRLDEVERDFDVLEGGNNDDNNSNISGTGSAILTSGLVATLKAPFFRLIKEMVKSFIEIKNDIPDSQKSMYDWSAYGLDCDVDFLKSYTSFDAVSSALGVNRNSLDAFFDRTDCTILFNRFTHDTESYISCYRFYGSAEDNHNLIIASVKGLDGRYYTAAIDDSSLFDIMENFSGNDIDDFISDLQNNFSSVSQQYIRLDSNYATYDFLKDGWYLGITYDPDRTHSALRLVNPYRSSELPFLFDNNFQPYFYPGLTNLTENNTFIYGIGYTMDYVKIDGFSDGVFDGVFSSKSGKIKPLINESQVSGLDGALDSKDNVIIDPKIVTSDDSDHAINTIANDNDVSDYVDTSALDTDKGLDSGVGNVEVDDNGEPVISKSVGGILKYVGDIWKKVKSLPSDVYNKFSGALSTISSYIKTLPSRISKALSSSFDKVVNAITSSPAAIYEFFNSPLQAIAEALNPLPDILNAIKELDIPVISDVVAAIEAIDIGSIVDSVTSLNIPSVKDIVEGIDIAGVIDAIVNLDIQGVIEAVTGIDLSEVVDAIQALDIAGVIEAVAGIDLSEVVDAIQALDIAGVIDAVTGLDISGVIDAIINIDIPIVSDIAAAIKNVIIEIFVPDFEPLKRKIDELKSHFAFIDDFKDVINKFVNDSFEPHNYITIPNIDKANNKYDKRDSYTISFAWYAPYKEYVDGILIAFIYLAFIWRIFMKLPGIISGTAGEFGNVDSMGADIANGSRSSGKGGGD